ncbi:MAG TPA: MFS transporter, partial [Gammaproteobacteria bacterium]|nr:MFS transporter [Gammaproteobacteria bacterium]
HQDRVLHEDPAQKSWWWALRYVLSTRTNVILIIASALGYFYFTGIRTFAVVFLRARFGLGQSAASSLLVVIGLGSIVGVLLAGRLADRLIQKGHLPARVTVGAGAFLFAALLFLPGLLVPAFAAAAALFFFASMGLGAANPPLDAARLDIMHSRLWGRAESIRTALRFTLEAIAPLLFGYVSTFFGGGGATFAGRNTAQGGAGLDYTFLIMLVTLIAAGIIMLRARKPYPRDVATAIASEHESGSGT